MECLACLEEFGDGDKCQNCGAYEGETDVDRIIRHLEEQVASLETDKEHMANAIRRATSVLDREFVTNDDEIDSLRGALGGLDDFQRRGGQLCDDEGN